MICEQCGHENEPSSKFCVECGTALRATGNCNDVSIKEMRESPTEKESDTKGEATFYIEAVKKQRRNFRLSGVGAGFALGFILTASEGIAVGIFVGVFCALIGYVVAELARHFVRNQRLLPKMEGSTIKSGSGRAEPEVQTVKQAEKPGASTNLAETLGGIVVFAVIAYMVWPGLRNYFGSDISGNLYNCEKHAIRQCKATAPGEEISLLDCLFTNNSQVRVTPGEWDVWNYDSDGILLNTTSVLGAVTVPPGQTIHIEVVAKKDASEGVICSMDPKSAYVGRDEWTLVHSSSDG